MAKHASKVVNQAQFWLGKKEKDGSFKTIIDTYNSYKPLPRGYAVKYTDEWCATFVSAVAIKLGYTSIIPAECGCEKQIELFKKLGCFEESDSVTPKAGWIIYYDWSDNGIGDNKGYADHVGIVEKVSNGVITVIEGNHNESVGRRTIPVNGKYIRGYGVPKYDAETVAKKSVTEIAKEVINGNWGNGAERKSKLTAAGYNYSEVQAEVNRLVGGTKKSNEEIAKEVINGNWGNGAARKQNLEAAGYNYSTIQSIVNNLLR